MIVRTPDPKLTRSRLEQSMVRLRAEVSTRETWFIREKYVDRGTLEPYYILDFREQADRTGDDLLSEPLFHAGGGFSIKNMTRRPPEEEYPYWISVTRSALLKRLERFMRMYRENYLQPPGTKEPGKKEHPRFEKRAFIYRLSSPRTTLVGIGPAMFAGGEGSALYGRVLDSETGEPHAFAVVELISKTVKLRRVADEQGDFWFSRVPPGEIKLRIENREHILTVQAREPFGNVRADIVNPENAPLPEVALHMKAPDEEIFVARSDSKGFADTGPLPGFQYVLTVPDHLFAAVIKPGAGATIAGTVRDEKNRVMKGLPVVLKQSGNEKARGMTDGEGAFRFDGLSGGDFALEVPGHLIFGRRVPPASIQGRVRDVREAMTLELILRDAVASRSAIQEGEYEFENLVPGDYSIRSPAGKIVAEPKA